MDEPTGTVEGSNSTEGSSNNDEKPKETVIVLNNNPYAYLERDDSTEKFKIEIRGLPKHYGTKELKRLLNKKLQLKTTKIKVPSIRSHFVYVCFGSEEDRLNAIEVINKFVWKNCKLKADVAKAVPDPLVLKRMQYWAKYGINKKPKVDNSEMSEKVRDAATPYWKYTYEEQGLLKRIGNTLSRTDPRLMGWWDYQKKNHNGLPCELLPIRHARPIDGYRNKCEFTIGMNEDTGERTIGFRLCSYVEGSVSVGPVDDALNVPTKMKQVVKIFQNFIRNSELDVYSPEKHTGYWRQLTARYGFKTDQLMLVIGLNPQELTEAELEEQKNKIKMFFTEGEGKLCFVTSLYFLTIRRKGASAEESIYQHIWGETHITEKLLGKTFRISPQAFFQVNTYGAEVLYEAIGELAGLTPDVTLLDVCCGTGTIGICLADKCGEVLGLDVKPESIRDAEQNASRNNVTNAQFFIGKAEEILSCVARRATKQDIVAILDPPRAGLHHDALVQLRKVEQIKRLVFVSCDPSATVKNFVNLGRVPSKTYQGDPFLPVRAVPVDLFTHTPHCELLVYLERRSIPETARFPKSWATTK